MQREEWEHIVADAASGKLSPQQMREAIEKADQVIQFIRQQVRYGRASQWQRAALENIQHAVDL
ncbi:MAG: hypothetical protein VKK04_03145 [Synechococcales bacterium]|nr:hypothetical protein [Synechococcales bacterium]